MPKPSKVTKAILQDISKPGAKGKESGAKLKVQFNPESLKIKFSNQIKGGNQRGGSAIQFSGKGTTRLSFDLWFDVTDPNIDAAYRKVTDVRRITKQVADLMSPQKKGSGKKAKYIPPMVRFLWGTFLFEGVVESINETIEYFSDDGRPLRASVAVSLMKQDVKVTFGSDPQKQGRKVPGTEPLDKVQQGQTLQDIQAKNTGDPATWPKRAWENDIDNARRLTLGTRLRRNP